MNHRHYSFLKALPRRIGPPPQVTLTNPQHQLNQIPPAAEWFILRDLIENWPGVEKALSYRAPPDTLGLYLSEEDAQGPEESFLLGTEFAHLHPTPDGSLHMTLPRDVQRAVLEKGWGVKHPLAGVPSVSELTTLVYAPRDEGEREVVLELIRCAEQFARGLWE